VVGNVALSVAAWLRLFSVDVKLLKVAWVEAAFAKIVVAYVARASIVFVFTEIIIFNQ